MLSRFASTRQRSGVAVSFGLVLLLGTIGSIDADVLFPPDEFSNGNAGGWEGAGPTVESNGGPQGDGDGYLKVIATEVGRQGSRAAVYNTDPFWIDNVASSVGFTFDMVNFESSAVDLEMRLVLFGPNANADRWTSLEPISVPSDGLWESYRFSLAEEDFTRVNGDATFDEMISDVQRIMLRHDAGEPSAQGTPVLATIGLDNLALDFGPCFFGVCDLNGDGSCDIQDLDSLMATIAREGDDPSMDFNADGVVDDLDRDFFLTNASSQFGFAGPILLGDANLDGAVNAKDLNSVALNWQTDKAAWSEGNFSGRNVDAADLNALALNWRESVPQVAAASHAVPEPGLTRIVLIALVGFIGSVRRHQL